MHLTRSRGVQNVGLALCIVVRALAALYTKVRNTLSGEPACRKKVRHELSGEPACRIKPTTSSSGGPLVRKS